MEDNGLSEEAVNIYRTIFELADLDGGGDIEIAELKFVLGAVQRRPPNAELLEMLSEIGVVGESIDFTQFLSLMIYLQKRKEREALDKMKKKKRATFCITAVNRKAINNGPVRLSPEKKSLLIISSKRGTRSPQKIVPLDVDVTGLNRSMGKLNLIADEENCLDGNKNEETTSEISSTIKALTDINEG